MNITKHISNIWVPRRGAGERLMFKYLGDYKYQYYIPELSSFPEEGIVIKGFFFTNKLLSFKKVIDLKAVILHHHEKTVFLIKHFTQLFGKKPLEFKKENGQGAIVTPSFQNINGYRVTYYDTRGFSGHSEYSTKLKAAEEIVLEGHHIPCAGYLSELGQTQEFHDGNEAVRQAHLWNRKKCA